MAQTVTITLTTAGADSGPFDLYSDADSYVTAFETGVAKAALEAGYVSVVVPDGATIVRVTSTGLCENSVDLQFVTTTTTTTTSTSTTTTTTTTTSTTTSTTTTEAPSITVETSLNEAVGGTPTWRAVWNTGGSNTTHDCVGTQTQGPESISLVTSTVTCTVTRPSGVTEDLYQIIWKINGSNAPNPDGFAQPNPQTGLAGATISFVYTFTGIITGDDLSVELTEG